MSAGWGENHILILVSFLYHQLVSRGDAESAGMATAILRSAPEDGTTMGLSIATKKRIIPRDISLKYLILSFFANPFKNSNF